MSWKKRICVCDYRLKCSYCEEYMRKFPCYACERLEERKKIPLGSMQDNREEECIVCKKCVCNRFKCINCGDHFCLKHRNGLMIKGEFHCTNCYEFTATLKPNSDTDSDVESLCSSIR